MKKSGNLTPSPARELRTSVRWHGADLPTSRGDGYGRRTLELKWLLEKEHRHAKAREGAPLLVYFFTGRNDERLIDYEAAVWNDERVGLAARMFNCYRISIDDMLLEADRKRFGKKGPNIVLIDPSGKTVKSFPGWRTTSAQVYGAMESLVAKVWNKRLGAMQPQIAAILKELDELHADLEKHKKTLKSAQEHVKKHDCAPGRKRIKTTTALIKDAESRLAKVLAKEKDLLGFAGVGGEPTPKKK